MSRIEDEVCKRIQERAEVGKSKYGVTMETAPLSQLEWLIHAQEEAMDLAGQFSYLSALECNWIRCVWIGISHHRTSAW